MERTRYRSAGELEEGMPQVLNSPKDEGQVEMILRRPDVEQREILEQAELEAGKGMLGDNWITRPSSSTPDGSPHPEKQITIMNSRYVRLIGGEKEHWPLAGDQFFVDMDLSKSNLPAGTRLRLGEALLEVSEAPHTGCRKFLDRFGSEAMKLTSSATGKEHNLRGINAMVLQSGKVGLTDKLSKVPA
jgi:hypothetical protein